MSHEYGSSDSADDEYDHKYDDEFASVDDDNAFNDENAAEDGENDSSTASFADDRQKSTKKMAPITQSNTKSGSKSVVPPRSPISPQERQFMSIFGNSSATTLKPSVKAKTEKSMQQATATTSTKQMPTAKSTQQEVDQAKFDMLEMKTKLAMVERGYEQVKRDLVEVKKKLDIVERGNAQIEIDCVHLCRKIGRLENVVDSFIRHYGNLLSANRETLADYARRLMTLENAVADVREIGENILKELRMMKVHRNRSCGCRKAKPTAQGSVAGSNDEQRNVSSGVSENSLASLITGSSIISNTCELPPIAGSVVSSEPSSVLSDNGLWLDYSILDFDVFPIPPFELESVIDRRGETESEIVMLESINENGNEYGTNQDNSLPPKE